MTIGAGSLRRRLFAIYGGLTAWNGLTWLAAVCAFRGQPALLGIAGLAYLLGLRHAVDADHIAAIDNATRKLMHAGERPVSVGLFFSLGHSTVVLLVAMIVAASAGTVAGTLNRMAGISSLGTVISVGFLVGIALVNLTVLRATYRQYRQVRAGGVTQADNLSALPPAMGPLGRIFSPALRLVTRGAHMYPVGFLFGLGFDTATEIAVLGIAAVGLTRFGTRVGL